jgi:hypothetical protein
MTVATETPVGQVMTWAGSALGFGSLERLASFRASQPLEALPQKKKKKKKKKKKEGKNENLEKTRKPPEKKLKKRRKRESEPHGPRPARSSRRAGVNPPAAGREIGIGSYREPVTSVDYLKGPAHDVISYRFWKVFLSFQLDLLWFYSLIFLLFRFLFLF